MGKHNYGWHLTHARALSKTGFCAFCGDRASTVYHHIIPKELGGSHEKTNIIELCRICHYKAHAGKIDLNKVLPLSVSV